MIASLPGCGWIDMPFPALAVDITGVAKLRVTRPMFALSICSIGETA